MTHLTRSKPKPKVKLPALAGLSKPISFDFEAIGTAWSIDLYDDAHIDQTNQISAATLIRVQTAIQARIEVFDKDYSRFRSDSLISAMAKQAGEYDLPADAAPLFDLYQDLYDETNGAMTPLIGQLLADAGYDADYSFKTRDLSTPPAWSDALSYNFPKLQLKQPVLLDVGAAGKGYLVDIIGDILIANKITNFCIDAGGDILYKTNTKQTLRIGLEHPDNLDQVIGVASVNNQSVCGSSSNRRAWGDFNHIMDPRRLHSPDHLKAVWVIADTALLADALTTALYFTPANQLHKRYTFEYALLTSNLGLEHSANFPAEFFIHA